MNERQTVFVGLSGGVDSSVAAARLIEQGYDVVGVFIKVWHPDFMVCNWEQERLDAMRVAAHLEIPFLTCDAEAEYRDEVAKYFIEEYKAGRTPNPDVMCNKQVKFGAFLRFAKEHKADFIATGHYAQRIEDNNRVEMHRGVDEGKDQTYFLWTLSNEQLEYSLFPVGDTPKDKIRDEATRLGVPTATKKDSQGICFLGHVDIPEFLSHYIDLKVGDVLNQDGQVIGKHKGALVYTIGQRHGFTLHTKDTNRGAMYVVDRDIDKNTITVSSTKPETNSSDVIQISNLVLRDVLKKGDVIEAQFRYRQAPFKIEVLEVENSSLEIKTTEPVEIPALGQSCVLYRGTHCIGGGIIS
ncbi:tRNA 2-thiouridine(34) synthase MnmA [Candidatus Nomurabacteria bacterium]|nr:tRNA 2-thiouridine(34) synthase MnmA [Candidatus Nomurabacteria bacterium]MCB9818184.1 tRNA 2-thiouridine(34) synthase MnmA [Candidatus Nomurabacteria bacterium]